MGGNEDQDSQNELTKKRILLKKQKRRRDVLKALGVKGRRYHFWLRSGKILQGGMSGQAETPAADVGAKQEAPRWLVVGVVKAA